MAEEIFTRKGLAEWTKTPIRTIDYLVATSQIPYIRWGKRGIRFIKEDVIEHMRNRSGVAYHRGMGIQKGANP